jgi:NAD(P)-dependent dehydrogenase (short-subunit alcohol dehydrogenase family)
MSSVLITGAATGIGNLAARALAADGHRVYATMRHPDGANAARATELHEFAERDGLHVQVVELDVLSETSVTAAVNTVLRQEGALDVVVHNAGHLALGYSEAFTAPEIAGLFDTNVLGMHRVNRAVLPYMRARRSGTAVYVGSTTTVDVPPFMAPYVASKAAFDALAQTTAYEINKLGIETTIVMPGAFTQGTDHFPNASHPGDAKVIAAYAALDEMVEHYSEATERLFNGADANPVSVAAEISRLLKLPVGQKPFRTVVDFTGAKVLEVSARVWDEQQNFITRMGMSDLLRSTHH